MHGLRTSSVLVLDDKEEDALKIQRALALEGIGALLVPGAPEQLRPARPLSGVRVAVLDIDLGVGTDAVSRVRHTMGIVRHLIDARNGPFVAVVWTGNDEYYQLFEEELRTLECRPVSIEKIDKAPVLDLAEEECSRELLGAIGRAVERAPALEFANLWEQVVRDAGTDTLVSLALAEQPGDGESQAMSFLSALLRAGAEVDAAPDAAAGMGALLAALNPIHFDKVEALSSRLGEDDLAAVAPILDKAKEGSPGISLSDQAQLNGALLFDPRADGFGPGRLYGYRDIKAIDIAPALPSEQTIREDTFEREHAGRAGDLPVVFLEVSAACDHQQGKLRVARLIAGVVFVAATYGSSTKDGPVKKAERAHARSGDHLRALEPARIDVDGFPSKDVRIVWNAHYPLTLPVENVSGITALGRFREPLLADVRAWLGYHAGRPGYVSIG